MNTDNRDVPRLNFAKTTAAAAFGLATSRVAPGVLAPPRGSAGEKVVVGICGVNSRSLDHAQNFSKIANAEVAYICDVDANVIGKALAMVGNNAVESRREGPRRLPSRTG